MQHCISLSPPPPPLSGVLPALAAAHPLTRMLRLLVRRAGVARHAQPWRRQPPAALWACTCWLARRRLPGVRRPLSASQKGWTSLLCAPRWVGGRAGGWALFCLPAREQQQ